VSKGGGFGLEWQIGPLVWLPNPRAKGKSAHAHYEG
jgi:hypothetical protein